MVKETAYGGGRLLSVTGSCSYWKKTADDERRLLIVKEEALALVVKLLSREKVAQLCKGVDVAQDRGCLNFISPCNPVVTQEV